MHFNSLSTYLINYFTTYNLEPFWSRKTLLNENLTAVCYTLSSIELNSIIRVSAIFYHFNSKSHHNGAIFDANDTFWHIDGAVFIILKNVKSHFKMWWNIL